MLTVVGTGDTLAEARDAAYAKVALITFPGGFYRTDIALGGRPRPELTERGTVALASSDFADKSEGRGHA